MNDTMRNSVIETSRNILMEPTAEVPNHSYSNVLMFESSPVNTGNSSVNHLAQNVKMRDSHLKVISLSLETQTRR